MQNSLNAGINAKFTAFMIRKYTLLIFAAVTPPRIAPASSRAITKKILNIGVLSVQDKLNETVLSTLEGEQVEDRSGLTFLKGVIGKNFPEI